MKICKQMRPLSYDIKALNGRKKCKYTTTAGVVSAYCHFLTTYCHFLKTALTTNQRCMPMVRRSP